MGGSPGKNFKSEESRMCGAKRSEAKPPTIRLRRLKNFPQGTPGRAQKQNSGFHKDLIQGVFSVFSPGHLPKKPSPFTDFFLNFHISLIFSLLSAAAYFSESRTTLIFCLQKFHKNLSPVHLLKKAQSIY